MRRRLAGRSSSRRFTHAPSSTTGWPALTCSGSATTRSFSRTCERTRRGQSPRQRSAHGARRSPPAHATHRRGCSRERSREQTHGHNSQRSWHSYDSRRSAPSRSLPRRDLAPDRPRPLLDLSRFLSTSSRPLSTALAPPLCALSLTCLARASPFAGQKADDDIFVQPQLLHAHAALLLHRMHRGAEHLVAGVFEYYSWMPQVAVSSA